MIASKKSIVYAELGKHAAHGGSFHTYTLGNDQMIPHAEYLTARRESLATGRWVRPTELLMKESALTVDLMDLSDLEELGSTSTALSADGTVDVTPAPRSPTLSPADMILGPESPHGVLPPSRRAVGAEPDGGSLVRI